MPVRISADQIAAAAGLSDVMDPWRVTDGALNALRTRFPEFDLQACALKVCAINSLYNTNLYAIWSMAEHCSSVMTGDSPPEGPALVDALALLGRRRHISFASKFAHFFVNSEAYPIYDYYAVKMVAHVLQSRRVWPNDYSEFFAWVSQVREVTGCPCTLKELDQYLWLGGMYREFLSKDDAKLSRNVMSLFRSQDSKTQSMLALLH